MQIAIKNLKKNFTPFFLYLACSALLGCNPNNVKLIKESRFYMGTLFDITVLHADARKAEKIIDKVFDEIKRIELMTSKFIPNSEVSKINQSSNENAYPISEEVYNLLKVSVHYSQITRGAFDITIGVIQDLWNFDNEEGQIPSSGTLLPLLSLVGFKNIALKENFHVRLKKKGMKLDLGAIAKGYAVNRGIEILRNNHINNAILNGGGDLKCIGEKKQGSPWEIGVRHPRDPSSIIATLKGNNQAIATSGDYQNYFVKNKVRYHHLLNPETGWPAKGTQSATIISNNAMLADAMATAVFIMGPERGIEFIESQKGLEGFLITSDGDKIISTGLKKRIQFHENN